MMWRAYGAASRTSECKPMRIISVYAWQDYADGFGDCLLPLQHNLLEQLGWKRDDKINAMLDEFGNLLLQRSK